MKKGLLALALLTVASGGVWAYRSFICCGNPSAPCCPLKK